MLISGTGRSTREFPSARLNIGQCHLLLKTNETTLLGPPLTIGDVYGDGSLDWIGTDRLNGLITSENHHCSLIGFFVRDIRVGDEKFSRSLM